MKEFYTNDGESCWECELARYCFEKTISCPQINFELTKKYRVRAIKHITSKIKRWRF